MWTARIALLIAQGHPPCGIQIAGAVQRFHPATEGFAGERTERLFGKVVGEPTLGLHECAALIEFHAADREGGVGSERSVRKPPAQVQVSLDRSVDAAAEARDVPQE